MVNIVLKHVEFKHAYCSCVPLSHAGSKALGLRLLGQMHFQTG